MDNQVQQHTTTDEQQIHSWLLAGDVAIQYMTHRDLLDSPLDQQVALQHRITTEGWGKSFLEKQLASGHWGKGFYRNRWANTHYTLLDLKNLGISQDLPAARRALEVIISETTTDFNSGRLKQNVPLEDICVNGMFLNYAAYFGIEQEYLHPIIDYIVDQIMPDGGFNCMSTRSGAKHSSLHSTLSVAEGFREYILHGYKYRLSEVRAAERSSQEFMLMHNLYKSDHSGQIIDNKFLQLAYPSRWRYDILRALDYLRLAEVQDKRTQSAVDQIIKKRNQDGRWQLQAYYPGTQHFKMEQAGKPSRWNTLRALRVLRHFGV